MYFDSFVRRHIGPSDSDIAKMLSTIDAESLKDLIDQTVPETIRLKRKLKLPKALSEQQALEKLQTMANQNQQWRSFLGMGYHRCYTPTVILRNLIEDPGWYTSYTPYQAEISQGRLEALLTFQTMVQDLTGMEISNSSLLDEATAAAEAVSMVVRSKKKRRKGEQSQKKFIVSNLCHPNTISVVKVRAKPLGLKIEVVDHNDCSFDEHTLGVLLQYPATDGTIYSYEKVITDAKEVGAKVIMATDLMSLTHLKPPGELGADIVVGNTQRFGVPLGYGGPHAAFLACSVKLSRSMPGRIIGVSVDAVGNKALRMALQSREQHIRREKATSNVCTAQALLANVAAMYGVYHGPQGLKNIAGHIHSSTCRLAASLSNAGCTVSKHFFDTINVKTVDVQSVLKKANQLHINLRYEGDSVIIALDECITEKDLTDLASIFGAELVSETPSTIPPLLVRQSTFMTHATFSAHHSETEMLRYLHKLAKRDLALDTAMIPLGSCTMKLNATSEMIPITWPGFNSLHPNVPREQTDGYQRLFEELEDWLSEITGFDAVSLQPNAGSQGEYAGLLAIKRYHQSRGDDQRTICLIPTSAHGTNPASAVMVGMTVQKIQCDKHGNIDIHDLRAKAEAAGESLAALMVTYPSTHGVFEEEIMDICSTVHQFGGQVYMDGANMNAMVGVSRFGDIGGDVCHLNLHKTFCIPHGGGGPGVGPIGVKSHLIPFLPGDPLKEDSGAVSGAMFGSASILPISWAYIAMCGADGLKKSSEVAILSANYLATRLSGHYSILYRGKGGRSAHECILDVRPFKQYGVEVTDIAKRLIDYGFHAPTMSWPVAGTLMVEPTESEPLAELDRFVEAMIMIREEIQQVIDGSIEIQHSPLRQAPHTQECLMQMDWSFPYTRETAAFPTRETKENKYWPAIRRINDAHGDRNLICSCSAWFGDDE
jgi:glycine dehydrogenase